ncbi:4Fe-4S binding protein [Anaerobacillus isosaccharinicus]|uniref:4Fe-4S binding protein n=1 Tax=Anaerobacillus isosaccharinicus TaxID=1532552 RepID=A0A1S2KW44_9BACI|nr:4Fe-4S binding protein [Anaerobacillus isosaccharinicus]MBA5584776.1 4Fe-4S binding protein [Anaerobacillus isosaccharinicus]QOY36859.1 4Fe-4S binding protein [Anaerobacillus isosaccharinicus]
MALPEKNLPSPKKPFNFLDIPFINKFIKSKWYPGIFQWLGMAFFGLIVFELMTGTVNPHRNWGTAMTWVLWWPVVPILFVLVGRFWCAVCPFGKISDIVRRLVGSQSPMPKFLKKYGIWLIDITFIVITWADHIFGVVHSPRGSGILLLLLLTMVVVTSVFYERRTFCKSLCFLGGLAGNYSRAGTLELRGNPDICRTCKTQACYKGSEKAEACNMFQFVRTMDNSAECNLCGDCVKNCPNDSIRISPRKPTMELWGIKKPMLEQSFLAAVIMGIVLVQNVTMLEVWDTILNGIGAITRTSSFNVNFTIAFIIAMIIPIGTLWYVSKLGSKTYLDSTTKENFIRFGYAYIPIDLAGHLGHNLFHLLTETKALYYNTMGLFGHYMTGDLAIVSEGTVQILQFILVGFGTWLSMYVVYRIGNRKSFKQLWPFYLLMLIFGILNFYLFSLPMDHRVH